jgi:hypothetical protein
MAFTFFSGGLMGAFGGVPPPRSQAYITTASFGELSALGEIPITNITGSFVTYSILNAGTVVVTGQTGSSYTITGLPNDTPYGPVTIVAYDTDGLAAPDFTVTGGVTNNGRIYTWACIPYITFSNTGSSVTTLNADGYYSFQSFYVTYTPTTAGVSPASGTNVVAISANFTGLTPNTTYTFTVYPVNTDGVPSSATGNNYAQGTVTTPLVMWVAGGNGGNNLAYSVDGYTWTGITGTSIFSSWGWQAAYGKGIWTVAGQGTNNTMAYSTNGVNWTGRGTSIFPSGFGHGNMFANDKWIVTGGSTLNAFAYSTDGVNWNGLGKPTLAGYAYKGAYNPNSGLYAVAGHSADGKGDNMAYSYDGITWNGMTGTTIFSTSGNGNFISYGSNGMWIAGGAGGNSLAYSTNGTTWIGRGSSVFSTAWGAAYKPDPVNDYWVAVGQGTNSIAYSKNGITWTGITGKTIFSNYGFNVVYSVAQDLWVAVGDSNSHTIAYSKNGVTWTGRGRTAFTSVGRGIAVSQ